MFTPLPRTANTAHRRCVLSQYDQLPSALRQPRTARGIADAFAYYNIIYFSLRICVSTPSPLLRKSFHVVETFFFFLSPHQPSLFTNTETFCSFCSPRDAHRINQISLICFSLIKHLTHFPRSSAFFFFW